MAGSNSSNSTGQLGSVSDTARAAQGFGNRAVVLCRPDDPRLVSRWGQRGGFEQAEDGPVMLVIGSDTDDSMCERLGRRFGVEFVRLQRFRDDPRIQKLAACHG